MRSPVGKGARDNRDSGRNHWKERHNEGRRPEIK